MNMNSYETLVVERRGAVGWLIFDRPDAGNAMDAVMMAELEQAGAERDADPAVRVVEQLEDLSVDKDAATPLGQ